MTESNHVPLLFYIVALIAVLIFIYNLRRFFAVRLGKAESRKPARIIPGIVNALVIGIAQRRVMRTTFTYASVMHFFLGWGFMELLFATTVDFIVARDWFVNVLPTLDTPWFAFINDLGGIMLFAGLLMALFRRHMFRPETLPQDSFQGRGNLLGDSGVLVLLLFLVIGGFLSEAARLGVDQPITSKFSWIGYPLSKIASLSIWVYLQSILWWSHAGLSLLFIAFLPRTKMFHAIAVIVNVALTNNAERGKLRTMQISKIMEDPDVDVENVSLGANTASEFTWKQLLDSVACTECGRCTSVCPAHLTGKPLSPMKLITDICSNLYNQFSGKSNDVALVGGSISEAELWSCTTCGACMEECPVLIDHIPTFTDMRRFLVLSEGKPPRQASESLEKTLNTGNPWGFSQEDRTKWALAAGLDLPILSQKKEVDVLYWVGCAGSFDPRNQQVARAMVKIFESAGIDYAVLGDEEKCTGDSARRLGEEYLFETMATQNIETLNKYSFNQIVTACPHCMHTIKNEYPDFNGDYKVTHHTQYINQLISSGKLDVSSEVTGKVTYHDACYLGRHNGEYEAPRDILKNIINSDAGGKLLEMGRNRSNSFCCGAGGGNMWYEIDEGKRMNTSRFQEAVDTGADTVVTACSFCTINMDDAMKVKGKEDSMQVKDVAEMVAVNLD
ncbi:MAG: (Fe-S)-binding protein [Candidatus Neomarinimicrobiota bacterium]